MGSKNASSVLRSQRIRWQILVCSFEAILPGITLTAITLLVTSSSSCQRAMFFELFMEDWIHWRCVSHLLVLT